MKGDFTINYAVLPVMAVGFTRATGLIARAIQLFRKILSDKSEPNHAFLVTEDHGQLFATEETLHGLEEKSLEQYTSKGNRIVAMYTWKGWNDGVKREAAQQYLAEIRRRAGEASKYDFKGLFSFVPILKKFVTPDPLRQWCSENCASIMKMFGAKFIITTGIAPDKLLDMMKKSDECEAVLNYYK